MHDAASSGCLHGAASTLDRRSMKILYVEDDPEAQAFVSRALRESGFVVDTAGDGDGGLRAGLGRRLRRADPRREAARHERLRAAASPAPRGHERAGAVPHRAGRGGRPHRGPRARRRRLPGQALRARGAARARYARWRGATCGRRRTACCAWATSWWTPSATTSSARGKRIQLTPKEFQLLEYLALNTGYVLSRSMIAEKIWGHGFESYSNAIDVHVNNLRKKVDRGAARRS